MAIDCLILGPAQPYRGGIADTNHAFAKELVNQNIKVEIWTFTKLYPDFLFPGKSQFEASEKEFNFPISRKIHAYNPLNWKTISREINTLNPKQVVFRYWTPLLAIAWGTIAENLRPEINKIALVDNWKPHEPKPWDKILNTYFSSKMDQITTLSEAVYTEIINDVNIPVNKGFHPISDDLPIAIPKEEAKKKLNLNPATPYVLFFGLIRSYKGLDLLIDAFATTPLKNTATELLIVGEFYDKIEPYIEQIERQSLDSKIQIVNEFVSFEVARDYFCAADIVVQPYKTATQSGVTPLAYHFETPLVVSDLAGLKAPILKDKTGSGSAKEPEDLASTIHDLLFSEKLQEIKRNLKTAKINYSWKNYVYQWLSFTKS
jgi:glycosyltransferase involved in cell wall biosynthesis